MRGEGEESASFMRFSRSSWLRFRRLCPDLVTELEEGAVQWCVHPETWRILRWNRARYVDAQRSLEVAEAMREWYAEELAVKEEPPPIVIDEQFGWFLFGSGLADLRPESRPQPRPKD